MASPVTSACSTGPGARDLTASVVIPTLNEARNLPHVFAALPDDLHEVIIVDGGSVDGTVDVARSLRSDIRVIGQDRKGKGNALACGLRAARGDVVVLLDADGSTDPREIPLFLDALGRGADYVKGSRIMIGGASHDLTAWRRMGNAVLTRTVNRLFGTAFTDLCYGYNALWRRHLGALGIEDSSGSASRWGDGFEIETLLHLRAATAGLRIVEVASTERARIFGASNLRTIRDGIRIVRTIVREHRRSRHLLPATGSTVVRDDIPVEEPAQ